MSALDLAGTELAVLSTCDTAGVVHVWEGVFGLRLQLALRERYPNPFFWAAFICQGNPGPMVFDTAPV